MANKKSFALFITIMLVMVFGYFSFTIIENKTFSNNLNRLKYLELQAQVHMKSIVEKIKVSTDEEINSLTFNDDRFKIKIIKNVDQNNSYFISIETKDDTPVRLSQNINR